MVQEDGFEQPKPLVRCRYWWFLIAGKLRGRGYVQLRAVLRLRIACISLCTDDFSCVFQGICENEPHLR